MNAPLSHQERIAKDRAEFVQCVKAFGCLFSLVLPYAFILYPVWRSADSYSGLQNCQGNLKRIGIAVLQYSSDYDKKLPLFHSTGSGVKPPTTKQELTFGWADALSPYLTTPSAYHCPKDTSPSAPAPSTPGFTSYYFNANLDTRRPHFTFSLLTDPMRTILLGEGGGGNARYSRNTTEHQSRHTWLSTDVPDTRHLDGGSYFFCDGHVKMLHPNRISQGKSGVAQAPDTTLLSATFAPY